MLQIDKVNNFKSLHVKGDPIILYNIWDAGGAKAVADAGARAIATGSWSVAAAHGYEDGEKIPLDMVLQIVERITKTVDVPVTVDFEGGYALESEDVAANVRRIIHAGAVGINFEDRMVHGEGLHPIDFQVERIKAIKAAATDEGIPLFINARTDLFLGTDSDTHADYMAQAKERQSAYAEAGADGFFVPGLTESHLINEIVKAARLPVNVMMKGDLTSIQKAAALGVARISYGPAPYFNAISDLKKRFEELQIIR